jgi:hypothetical protein
VRQLVIENPVINSAFEEPGKHYLFTDDDITNEIVSARRPSAYFIPVAQPKKKGKQLELGTEWTDDRLRENDYINDVRAAVRDWRSRDYPGITRVTRRLLEYWQRPDRDRRLFFCEIEAVETACWFIDTDYSEESLFVRHAYFTGADEPYAKLQRALKAEIDEQAWASLYQTVSRPFDPAVNRRDRRQGHHPLRRRGVEGVLGTALSDSRCR